MSHDYPPGGYPPGQYPDEVEPPYGDQALPPSGFGPPQRNPGPPQYDPRSERHEERYVEPETYPERPRRSWRSKLTRATIAILLILFLIAAALAYVQYRGIYAPPGSALAAARTQPGSDTLAPTADPSAGVSPEATPSGTPSSTQDAATTGLAGRTIVLDPGHNGKNASDPDAVNKLVDVGNGQKACNTTGTSNDDSTESALNLVIADLVKKRLETAGATVVMTRTDDDGVGPCIDERAKVADDADADLSVSIHADGSDDPAVSGFHVIVPGADPALDKVVEDRNTVVLDPSKAAATAIATAYAEGTDFTALKQSADITKGAGVVARTDLGGLNLLTVPGVMIEMGMMTNASDAKLLAGDDNHDKIADAITAGITDYFSE